MILDWKVKSPLPRGEEEGSKRRAQPGFAKLTSKSGANGANFIPLQSSMMGWEVQLR